MKLSEKLRQTRAAEPQAEPKPELDEWDYSPQAKEQIETSVMENAQSMGDLVFEEHSRQTVLKLFKMPVDTPFTFCVAKRSGENYINAMRQIISRTRKQAKSEKITLAKFKVLVKSFHSLPTHDEITLVRTTDASLKQKLVFSELAAIMAEPGQEKSS